MKSLDGEKNVLLMENLKEDLAQLSLKVRKEILVPLGQDSIVKLEITFGLHETNWKVSLLGSDTNT